MSHLHPGDDDMHYCDNSHRWIAPPEIEQRAWSAQVRAHMQEHLLTMGGPAPAGNGGCVPPRHLYPAHVGRGVAAPPVRRTRSTRTTASPGQRVVAVGRAARDTTREANRDPGRDKAAAK